MGIGPVSPWLSLNDFGVKILNDLRDSLIVEGTDNTLLTRGFDFDQDLSDVLRLQQFKNKKTFASIQMLYKLYHVRRSSFINEFYKGGTVLLTNMSFNVLDQLFIYSDCLKSRQD